MIIEESFKMTPDQAHEVSHSGMLLQLEAIRKYQHTRCLHAKTLLLSAIYAFDAMACDHIMTEEVAIELQEIHNKVSPEVKTKIESVLFKN